MDDMVKRLSGVSDLLFLLLALEIERKLDMFVFVFAFAKVWVSGVLWLAGPKWQKKDSRLN